MVSTIFGDSRAREFGQPEFAPATDRNFRATELLQRRCVRFGGRLHHFGQNGDVVMARIRTSILAAGAAALLSSQAVYAAPARSGQSLDPLVSLSALASVASRTAVCAGSTAAAAAASAAAQPGPTGTCVLPLTTPAPPPAPVAAVAPVVSEPKSIGILPILLGAAALAGLIALILASDDDGNGDNTPVSPA